MADTERPLKEIVELLLGCRTSDDVGGIRIAETRDDFGNTEGERSPVTVVDMP